ncbi:MAG: YwaF family protein, partial [Erysipelotrichaceae bacterium]|nr:YwaF family protein [Erysipelotrichaceae bacterium]
DNEVFRYHHHPCDLKNYLPLEVCSMAGYLIIIDCLLKENAFTSKMLLLIFLPPAIMALVYPTSVDLPLHNIFTYHQYLFHGIIVSYVLSRFLAREITLDFKGLWFCILVFFVIAMTILCIDKTFNKNFMFLAHDENNAMLKRITSFCGSGIRYTLGLSIFFVLGLNVCYLVFKLLEMLFLR